MLPLGNRLTPPGGNEGGEPPPVEGTSMEPSTASLFVQETLPPVIVNAAPLATGWLNSLNLSPGDRAGPRLLTFMVPVPVLLMVPDTTTRSFEGDKDLLISTTTSPLRTRLPLMVRVPTDAPAASVAPAFTVTLPPIVPVPPSLPGALTVTSPLPVPEPAVLLTNNVPSRTVVVLVRVLLSPEKTMVPGPALTSAALSDMLPEKVVSAVLLTINIFATLAPRSTGPLSVRLLLDRKSVV